MKTTDYTQFELNVWIVILLFKIQQKFNNSFDNVSFIA